MMCIPIYLFILWYMFQVLTKHSIFIEHLHIISFAFTLFTFVNDFPFIFPAMPYRFLYLVPVTGQIKKIIPFGVETWYVNIVVNRHVNSRPR